MNREKAGRILQLGLDVGADFCEIFEEETRNASVGFRDRKVESATAGTEYGVGIRLIYGTDVLYAHTSLDDEEHLARFVRSLAASRLRSAEGSASSAPGVHLVGVTLPDAHAAARDPRVVGQAPKLELLKRADQIARATSPSVRQVSVRAFDQVQNVLICNTEGLWVEDRRTRARLTISVTAEADGERFSAGESPGALRGFEFFEEVDVDGLARTAAERAVRMLSAGYVEGKRMPVILGNGFGGVIFHEACGHPLETEAIRKKASPFVGKLGRQIAHPSVTAVDDGTPPHVWGSLNVDDEGLPVEKTVLIEKGVLRSYLSDRVGATEVGVPRTGSARRESYQYAPVSRMRNTYIAAGTDTFEDMLSGIDYGLYARKMGGGSVNPATGEFNFAVEEGYAIRNGQLAEPVRGATLIGHGHEILPRISMVGADLELAAGTCGASSGSVPVTVGQPTLKVDEILVGGR